MINSNDYFEFLRETRENYKREWNGNRRQDAYKFGRFLEMATPIERNVWSDCRVWGLEVYPQFPVGKYYIDFANPFLKIAIEVDGKIHEETKEKDRTKDLLLKEAGWTVYRIKGTKTYRKYYDYFDDGEEYDEEKGEHYEENTSEALIRKLAEDSRSKQNHEEGFDQIVSSNEIIKALEKDQPRKARQKLLNEYLFGYRIPPRQISYRAE